MFGRKRVLEIKWWDPHGWGLAMTANINYRFPPIFQWQNFFVICNPFPKLLFPHRQEWAGKTLSFLWEWICKVWGWSISCYLSRSNISSSKCKPQPAFCCTCKTPGFGLAQKERNNSWNKLSGSISFWWHSNSYKKKDNIPRPSQILYVHHYFQKCGYAGHGTSCKRDLTHSVILWKSSFLHNFYAETLGTPGTFRQSLNRVNKLLIACSKPVIDLSCMCYVHLSARCYYRYLQSVHTKKKSQKSSTKNPVPGNLAFLMVKCILSGFFHQNEIWQFEHKCWWGIYPAECLVWC